MMIEYCINNEWIASDLCQDFGAWQSEVATEYVNTAVRFAEDCGVEVVRAQGQRILYHPWNGSHFAERVGIFGSWEKLDDDTRQILEDADVAGRTAAEEFVAKLVFSHTQAILVECRYLDSSSRGTR